MSRAGLECLRLAALVASLYRGRALWSAGVALSLSGWLGAQEDIALKRLAEARTLHGNGRDEDAALSLRDAKTALAKVADANVQKSLQKSIDALVAKVDPLAVKALEAEEAAARALLRAAKAYQARKWQRCAVPFLRQAAELSEKVAGKALQQAGDGATADTTAVWFGDAATFSGGGVWRLERGVITSPQVGPDSLGWRTSKTTKDQVRVSIESKTTAEPSKTALVFGMHPSKDGDAFYVLELRHMPGFSQLRLLHKSQDGDFKEIALLPLTMSRAERAGWVTLWVELRGDRIRAGIGDIESVEANAVTKSLDGCLGVFISGDTPWKAPISFRNLRVEPL